MADNRDIAVVGMSCYFPGATNIVEFWDNLTRGVCSITDPPDYRIDSRFFSDRSKGVDRFYFRRGGFVSPIEIDPLQYGILPIAARGYDQEQLVALHLVREALADAGVFAKNTPLQNCCFIMGKGNYAGTTSYTLAQHIYMAAMLESIAENLCPGIGEDDLEKIRKEYQAKLARYQSDTVAGAMPNLVVSQAANRFDMKGPAYTIDAACASSLIAVEQAMGLLASGQCDIALAGGMHLGQGAPFWSVFNIVGAASHKGEIAPFDENADGLLIGEGAGIVVMKKLDKAIADGDRIYAIIKACGSSSDGSDVSIMAPSSPGQVATLKRTWEKAGMDPRKIGYVETHGTATLAGDRAEIETLTSVFGDNTAAPALLGSVKSNIGHAMPAAGIAGLIKTILALYHKKIPPTLNCRKPMAAMSGSRFQPAQRLVEWNGENYPLVAAVNAFGFGGINSHAILESYDSGDAAGGAESNAGVPPTQENGKTPRMTVNLDFATRTIREYPTLKECVERHSQGNGAVLTSLATVHHEELSDPVLRRVNGNLLEMAAMQQSMLEWHRGRTVGGVTRPAHSSAPLDNTAGALSRSAGEQAAQRVGSTVEKVIRFDLERNPYLADHCVIRQPAHRSKEELNPIVPFTMMLETLCDHAQELAPGRRVLRACNVAVIKQISVREPFEAPMTGQWKSPDLVSWSLSGYAYGDIVLGDEFPAEPEDYLKDFDPGDENLLPAIQGRERIYKSILFHGPRYQSLINVSRLTRKGLKAQIRKAEGKGSLMDCFGQLLGFYTHLAFDSNQITLPKQVDELIFFQDYRDQEGIFDYTFVVKEVKDHEIISNVIIRRGGKLWCMANGWRNGRMNYGRDEMDTIMNPQESHLAGRINSRVFYHFHDRRTSSSVLDFLYDRYLDLEERKHYRSLYPNQARDYLISRIALKDGVRLYLQKDERDDLIFPIDIGVGHDERGKPLLYGHESLRGLEISIAHKGSEAVAMVAREPVGIDIEKIEERSREFMELSFTPRELDLLSERNNDPEWTARLWVAKEAYAKMTGRGLEGNPKQWEVESIDGEELTIRDTVIKTTRHRDHYIVGWTQK